MVTIISQEERQYKPYANHHLAGDIKAGNVSHLHLAMNTGQFFAMLSIHPPGLGLLERGNGGGSGTPALLCGLLPVARPAFFGGGGGGGFFAAAAADADTGLRGGDGCAVDCEPAFMREKRCCSSLRFGPRGAAGVCGGVDCAPMPKAGTDTPACDNRDAAP
jgi:hypothetical protein